MTTQRHMLTNAEARAILHVSSWQVSHLARTGSIPAVKVDEYWRLDPDAVAAYAGVRRERAERLPAAPLLDRIRLRGGPAACGASARESRALHQAARSGWVTVAMADELAVRLLGLTMREVWESTDGGPMSAEV